MPITITDEPGDKRSLGRDHKLKCVLTWDDGTHPNLTTDVAAYYVSIKSSETLSDAEATIALNSIDNPDQFIVTDAANGELTLWIKRADQVDVAVNLKYYFDMVVVLTDGTEWSYIEDTVVFSQPITRSTS